jgi:hypothetical protein
MVKNMLFEDRVIELIKILDTSRQHSLLYE